MQLWTLINTLQDNELQKKKSPEQKLRPHGVTSRRCDWLVRTIHGHLVDLGGVVLLNVSQDPDVIILHKVDGHTLTTIATRPANPEGGQRSR